MNEEILDVPGEMAIGREKPSLHPFRKITIADKITPSVIKQANIVHVDQDGLVLIEHREFDWPLKQTIWWSETVCLNRYFVTLPLTTTR